MSRLIELALKDAKDCFSQSTMFQYQVKVNLESTLRGLQEECSMLNGLVELFKVTGEDDKDIDMKTKALAKLNKTLEVNRKLYTEAVKALSQMDEAINVVSRADRWVSAVAEDLK